MNKGFTLIELLVVVLIIGILAAIALPQYTKAVERSRISEAAQRLGDMATIAQIHYMQNNAFPTSYTDGSTDVTLGQVNTPSFNVSFNGGTLTATRSSGAYIGTLTLTVGTNGGITKSCAGNTEFCAMARTFGY